MCLPAYLPACLPACSAIAVRTGAVRLMTTGDGKLQRNGSDHMPKWFPHNPQNIARAAVRSLQIKEPQPLLFCCLVGDSSESSCSKVQEQWKSSVSDSAPAYSVDW